MRIDYLIRKGAGRETYRSMTVTCLDEDNKEPMRSVSAMGKC